MALEKISPDNFPQYVKRYVATAKEYFIANNYNPNEEFLANLAINTAPEFEFKDKLGNMGHATCYTSSITDFLVAYHPELHKEFKEPSDLEAFQSMMETVFKADIVLVVIEDKTVKDERLGAFKDLFSKMLGHVAGTKYLILPADKMAFLKLSALGFISHDKGKLFIEPEEIYNAIISKLVLFEGFFNYFMGANSND